MIIRAILTFLLFLSFNSFADMSTTICESRWKNLIENNKVPEKYKDLINLCDTPLKQELYKKIKNNLQQSYYDARFEMFTNIHNENGQICDVYSDICIKNTGEIPSQKIMNCEHTWPQSLGADPGNGREDIHHLYPATPSLNSRRNNHPFCEVANTSWSGYGSALGWSEDGIKCFEPRNQHKGSVARAMFYFSVRYKKKIDIHQESFFKNWNIKFVVSEKEIDRNNKVEEIQHNRNPFTDFPQLADLISDF